jgi:hypothetical protein
VVADFREQHAATDAQVVGAVAWAALAAARRVGSWISEPKESAGGPVPAVTKLLQSPIFRYP